MGTGRNGLIDYGLFLAVLGIVWFQSRAPGFALAYCALPFFLVLFARPTPEDWTASARQTLVPFVIWSIIFGMLQVALAQKNQSPLLGWWQPNMILTGTWAHLWVLPFAFFATLVSPWLRHPLASLGAALLAAMLIVRYGTPDTIPFGLWTFGAIPVLVSIAYFAWGWRLAVTTLTLSMVILLTGRPSQDDITILVGTALALIVLSNHLPASALSDWCGRVALWVYLAHPLAIIVGQSLRITYVELGLVSLVGSVILAQVIEITVQASRKGKLEF